MSHVRQPFENPVADVAEVRRLMLEVVMQVVAERVMGVRDAKRQFLRRGLDAVLRRVLPPLERAHQRVRVVRVHEDVRVLPHPFSCDDGVPGRPEAGEQALFRRHRWRFDLEVAHARRADPLHDVAAVYYVFFFFVARVL